MLLKIRKERLKKFLKLLKRNKLLWKNMSQTLILIQWPTLTTTRAAQSSDVVESSNEKSDSEDESSRDTQTGDEAEDPLSLPISTRDISGKSYDMKTWIHEIGSFPVKISIRARIVVYRDFRNLLGKEIFNLTLAYLKNKINLKKQNDVYNERGNASYALFGYMRLFLILGKYAKKSLDSPLPISHLLRWHTTKNDNIIEGDSFKYKGKSTKVVHSYLSPTVRETKKNCLATLKPYMDEVKDTVLDALKENLKDVTILTSTVESVEDECLSDHNPNQPCENFVPSSFKDENLGKRVASLEQSMVEIVSYIQEEKFRRTEKNKKEEEDHDNFSAPTVDDKILPLPIVDDDLAAFHESFAE
ncbi:hypothetical protein H5410_040653 [Solanum commersonii]|uniref:Uncharacterized protein n=1 Tax=Solanum commersonii TaxID=4109 RepID=A0A9J5XPG0_SOLCO|nr:hypothetical protein H5410_040653 [Solanum commersonii]